MWHTFVGSMRRSRSRTPVQHPPRRAARSRADMSATSAVFSYFLTFLSMLLYKTAGYTHETETSVRRSYVQSFSGQRVTVPSRNPSGPLAATVCKIARGPAIGNAKNTRPVDLDLAPASSGASPSPLLPLKWTKSRASNRTCIDSSVSPGVIASVVRGDTRCRRP
jgi:hypothetical protein